MAFKEIYISTDDFEGLQDVGRHYEGFVIGLGYAYVDSTTLMPPNMNGYLNHPNIPPNYNNFTLLIHQCVDNSPDVVELSMRGIAGDGTNVYTVQHGDTLTAIAQEHRVSVDDLVKWNNIDDANRIYAGQTLIVSEEANNFLGNNIATLNNFTNRNSVNYFASPNFCYKKNDAVYLAESRAREIQREEEWRKSAAPPPPTSFWDTDSRNKQEFTTAGNFGNARPTEFISFKNEPMRSTPMNSGVHDLFGIQERMQRYATSGKIRDLFLPPNFPDAISVTGGFNVSSGTNASSETGFLIVIRGENGFQIVPYNDVGAGLGALDASASIKITGLWYYGVGKITSETFYGERIEGNIGGGIGLTLGASAVLSKQTKVFGVGGSIGVGVLPFVSGSINWGAAGATGNDIMIEIRKMRDYLKIK